MGISGPGSASAEHYHSQQGKKNPVDSPPVKLIVNLIGAQQVFKLLHTGIRPKLKVLARHINFLKEFMQFPGSRCRVVPAFKAGQY